VTVPLPDPQVGGRAAKPLAGLSEPALAAELERRLDSIQRNFDKLASLIPVGAAQIKDSAVTAAKILDGTVTDTELSAPSRQDMLARPQTVLSSGTFQVGLTSTAGSFYLASASGAAPLLAATDTQQVPVGYYFDLAEWDVVPGYKPQFRIRGSFHSQTTDPGTQTFTCGFTNLVQVTGAGANNVRWSVSGTYSSIAVTNMAANATSIQVGSWADMATGMYGVYHHATVAIAGNAAVETLFEIEVRWIPE
jgi:hypothetical protein